MKRKFADRPNWSRIIKKTYYGMEIKNDEFCGYIGYLSLDKVKEKLWVSYGTNKICIVDEGYVWLQYFPLNKNYVLTATYNEKREFVQAYFDIVSKVGITNVGIPYCDDLFLDIVSLPNGQIFTLDENELSKALEENLISNETYDNAYCEAALLVESIQKGQNYLLNTTQFYFEFIRNIMG